MKLLAAATAAILVATTGASAQPYPAKPVNVVIGYAAGGPVDFLGRTLAERMTKSMGQPLLIVPKPGANERIATEYLRNQPADGYNVLLVVMAYATNPILFPSLPYDTAKDFTPLVHLADSSPILSVRADSPIRNLADLLQAAKARPGQVSFGSPGNASNNHLTMELLGSLAGVTFNHIPFKGDANSVTEVLGGRLDASMNALPSVVGQIQAGKLRGIGISSRTRSARLPDVPTFAEQGYPQAVSATWFGAVIRSGTPADVAARLNKEFNAALSLPEVREALAGAGMTAVGGSPEQFAALLRSETERWGRIIRERGVKVE
jgi:tripartite-type tricarboxylate transporter receptor subunit TctC